MTPKTLWNVGSKNGIMESLLYCGEKHTLNISCHRVAVECHENELNFTKKYRYVYTWLPNSNICGIRKNEVAVEQVKQRSSCYLECTDRFTEPRLVIRQLLLIFGTDSPLLSFFEWNIHQAPFTFEPDRRNEIFF